jgi:ribose transport system permease protein
MNAFLPLFIGGSLAKYSDRNIGILVGSFTQACIISGFAILGLSSSLQSILNAGIVLVFLVFTSNSYKIAEFKRMKEKRLKAQLALEKENHFASN